MNYCQTEQAPEIIDKYRTDQLDEDYIFPILDRNVHTTEKQILEQVKNRDFCFYKGTARSARPEWRSQVTPL